MIWDRAQNFAGLFGRQARVALEQAYRVRQRYLK